MQCQRHSNYASGSDQVEGWSGHSKLLDGSIEETGARGQDEMSL